MSKHTQGDWRLQVKGPGYYITTDSGFNVAVLNALPADAKLMAAAPAMLDILERITCQFESTPDKHSVLIGYSQIVEARNIIRKARGEA